jgi:small-conductance mechanosensitive channel
MGIAMLGVDLTNLALVAGALSVGIGFGLQGVVNNFVSGLILLFERPIRVGDWVVMNDQSGFIKRINIRATELETFDKSSVIIPNADILANMVVNWTHKDDFGRVDVRVGVAYDADTERVREVLLSCAREHPLVLAHYPGLEPFVLFQDYGRNRLEFELRCYTPKVVERTVIASDLRFEIERRFREEGINIPLPQEVLHFPDGWPPMLPGDNV